ncbi:hypothetical protein IQ259_25550 [Fortiea sp. LEGE XX443]|uniref:hypothetical protein n=1 Tax=Fortiea sp. LEGE XX443 TaxID=1828611 RepID=UPI00187FBF80|nr:hypothetical protein [Fortiea sp. LEGE XX443]MBE9008329.1 hypothetical protein [Fortiea sp. LEGE XX443]
MSISKILKSIINGATQVITYILGAVKRIFSPRDDNYPASGVQPFEGDIADDKHKY